MDKATAYNYIRSRFVDLKETRSLIKKHGLKIKYGFLSTEEALAIRKVVDNFLQERGLTMNDLRKHLVEDAEFPIHELLYKCTEISKLRTYKSIHTHLTYIYHPYIHVKWNSDEEIQLLDLVNQKGFNWKEISYHLSKYKDLCRLKYLRIKGENSGKLGKLKIQELLTCMPTTDSEWSALCSELKLNKARILQRIKRFLNGKILNQPERRSIMEIQLCLLVLNNNHYCKFHSHLEDIFSFLESEIQSCSIIEKVEDSKTPFIAKKSERENEANESPKSVEDELEALIEESKREKAANQSQVQFLNKFLGFFSDCKDFDLSVKINKDDIFWFNITREMNIEKSRALSKFNQLEAAYGWATFKDVYDTMIKLSYDYVMGGIKEKLLGDG